MKIKKIFILFIILIILSGCSKLRKAGTYEGIGQGRNGDIKVSVTVNSDGKIENIEILEHSENKEFIDVAYPILNKSMIDNNTYEVDMIAGATDTSNGIIEAVKNALNQAN